jgi:hypothetical protein
MFSYHDAGVCKLKSSSASHRDTGIMMIMTLMIIPATQEHGHVTVTVTVTVTMTIQVTSPARAEPTIQTLVLHAPGRRP